MSENEVLVSVVIPVYNAEKTVQCAVDSALNQTYPAHEIIVIDDGSTDRTADLVAGYGDRIIYLFKNNEGANLARNSGIQISTGNWIAFLDSDDEWLPEKLEQQVALIRKRPDLLWLYGNYYVRRMDLEDGVLKTAHDSKVIESMLIEESSFEDFMEAYARGIFVHTITMMIRRDILIEAGMFLPGQLINHDPDVALRISYRIPHVGYLKQPLAIHNFGRCNSVTQQWRFNIEERCLFIQRHLEISSNYDCSARFEKVALMLLEKWLREFKTSDPQMNVSAMQKQFRKILPFGFKCEMWIRTWFPVSAHKIIRVYSRIKKLLLGTLKGSTESTKR